MDSQEFNILEELNGDYEPLVGDEQGLDYLQKRRDEAVALLSFYHSL